MRSSTTSYISFPSNYIGKNSLIKKVAHLMQHTVTILHLIKTRAFDKNLQ